MFVFTALWTFLIVSATILFSIGLSNDQIIVFYSCYVPSLSSTYDAVGDLNLFCVKLKFSVTFGLN